MRYDGHFFARHVFLPPVAAALLLGALCGCSRLAVQHPGEGHGGSVGSVEIVVENFVGEVGSLRTIAPTQLTANDLSTSYTLRLTGTTGRQTLPEQTVTLNNGRGTLGDIPNGTWHLTLTAYPRTGTTAVAVLSGSATVTVRNGFSTEARFALTPVAVGHGTIRLTVNWQEADRNFVQPAAGPYPSGLTVSMALYDPATGQKATSYVRMADGSNGTQSDTDAFFRRGFTGNSGGSTTTLVTTFPYTGGTRGDTTYNVPAGMYRLKFMVTGGNLSSGTSLEWSDNLYVEPGRETTGTVNIPQLAQKPAAPSSLALQQEAGKKDGTYPVVLSWGGVYNATSYELQVIEYSAGTKPTDDASWQSLSQAAGAVVRTYTAVPGSDSNYADGEVHENQLHIEGGLLSGQGRLKMGLQGPGKKFTMRLRSSNAFGTSAWSYCPTEVSIAQVAVPAAPRNFTFTTGMYESTTQSFDAHLTWTDGGTDNDGFELELMRFSTGTTPRSDNDWNTQQQQGGTVSSWKGPAIVSATGDPIRVESGSLGGASSRMTVAIKRHTGKFYYAVRLRAYNEGGNSAWVYPAASALLIPLPNITWTTSALQVVGGKNTFTANVKINDVAGSACIYQIEFACLFSGSYSTVLSQTTAAAMDTEFTRLRTLAQNNTADGRGQSWLRNTLNIAISQLNENVAFPFRVRTVTTNNSGTTGTVVDYTPWVYCPKAVQNINTSYP